MQLRDYTFIGTTQSLCPECRRVVHAKIIVRDQRVYFRKSCPEHGTFDDFICSDVSYYDRHELSQPARLPEEFGTESAKGCPYDCGICPEHEQHTCVALIEITSSCNLKCPMCFAESGPGGEHMSYDTFTRLVDRYVELEGIPDVVQISGGEPTIHPDLLKMTTYAYQSAVQVVMINTNGIRLAHDEALVASLATMRDKLEIYLQFDGFDVATHEALRGEELLQTKLRALEHLAKHNLRCTLVCTVDHRINLHEVGKVVQFGLERKIIRGVSFQLATYCGRHLEASDLENRVTMPDLVRALATQTNQIVSESDFYPLPCADPNCHMMCYLYRGGETPISVSRLIDVEKHADLLANSVIYTPARARHLVARHLEAAGGCGCGPGGCGPAPEVEDVPLNEMVVKALAEQLTGEDVFRIMLTGFLDVHTFDTRRAMKCCIAHLLPSGHMVPFCTYNTLYRDGFLPLPPLATEQDQPVRRPVMSLSLLES